MCRTIKILISNWPRMRKFSQLLQEGKTVAFDFSHLWSLVGHALHPIFMLWLVKISQLSSCGKFMQHLETCLLWQLKLTEFCVNLRCPFLLDVQNEIQLLSRVVCYSWLVCLLGFWLRNKLIFTVKWMTHLSLSPDRAHETITEATKIGRAHVWTPVTS